MQQPLFLTFSLSLSLFFVARLGYLPSLSFHLALFSRFVRPASFMCRFKPRLTRKAKQRRARSYSEMSVGDAKRREASVRITKLEQERDIADKLSFEPKLHQGAVASRLSQVVDGKLRITSEPETYVVTSSLFVFVSIFSVPYRCVPCTHARPAPRSLLLFSSLLCL